MTIPFDLIWASLIAFAISMLPLVKGYIISHFILEKLFKYGARFVRWAYRKNIVFVTADHHYQNHDRKKSPADCSRGYCSNIKHRKT